MISLKNINFRMYMVNIILPFFILSGIFQVIVMVWYLEGEVNKDGIECRRFLYKPLQELFSGKEDIDKELPEWMVFVAMEDGRMLFPMEAVHPGLKTFLKSQRQQMDIFRWASAFVQVLPDNLSVVNFHKDGIKGVFMYRSDLLPFQFKILQSPRHIGFVFLTALLFFSMGVLAMNSHNRNINRLVEATRNIMRMDLDKPIGTFSCRNEMAAVFEAFEDMRLEIRNTRKKGAILLSSITHDMKTPLTSMRVYLEALKDGVINSPEEGMAAVDKILSKAGMLEDRINEMIYLFKGFSQGMIERQKSESCEAWLKELSELFREESVLSGRRYTEQIQMDSFPILKGNYSMHTRAVHNLMDNACRYTEEEDQIRLVVRYQQGDDAVLLKMEDSGPGIREEDQEYIFDLFYRADQGRNSRGMGIGLASIKFLMDEIGGSISYSESELGGACFTMLLPLFYMEV